MPNLLDNMDIITEDNQSVNVLFQDRGTLAIAQQNAASISALGLRVDGVDLRIDGVDNRIDNVDTRIDDVDTRIDNINEGIYNNTTPTSGLTTNIGLEAGAYNITSDLTINAQLVVPKGAILNISSGVTLTINSELLAGRYQIFTGSGSVVIKGLAYPEWFGAACDSSTNDQAAIQKAIDSSNGVSLDFGVYAIGSTLTISGNKTIKGQKGLNLHYANENPSYDGSVLKPTHSSGNVITLSGVGNVISDLIIDAGTVKTGLTGVHCSECVRFHLTNLFIRNCGTGVYVTKNITSYIDNVHGYCDYDGNSLVFGFDLEGQQNGPYTGMASLYITNCAFGFNSLSSGSIGIYSHGSINDTYIDKFECASAVVGIQVSPTSTSLTDATDYFISNCVLDGCRQDCIYVDILPGSTNAWIGVNISDTWCANVSGSGTCIRCAAVNGINIANCQLFTKNYGIQLTTCYFINIDNVKITCDTFAANTAGVIGTTLGVININNLLCKTLDYAVMVSGDYMSIHASGYECTANAHGINVNTVDQVKSSLTDITVSNNIVKAPYTILT